MLGFMGNFNIKSVRIKSYFSIFGSIQSNYRDNSCAIYPTAYLFFFFTSRQWSCGKVMFSVMCVCNSICPLGGVEVSCLMPAH